MKFTAEKPTVPGWYIHRYHEDEMAVKIVSVKGELWCEVGQVLNMNGEWSERLVPVGEVDAAKAETEKVRAELQAKVERMRGEVEKAYEEGHNNGFDIAPDHLKHLKAPSLDYDFKRSRARRVVEGKEEV